MGPPSNGQQNITSVLTNTPKHVTTLPCWSFIFLRSGNWKFASCCPIPCIFLTIINKIDSRPCSVKWQKIGQCMLLLWSSVGSPQQDGSYLRFYQGTRSVNAKWKDWSRKACTGWGNLDARGLFGLLAIGYLATNLMSEGTPLSPRGKLAPCWYGNSLLGSFHLEVGLPWLHSSSETENADWKPL